MAERVGEIHDGEVIETVKERFARCRFFDCKFVGRGSLFYDCEFVFSGQEGSLAIEVDDDGTPTDISLTGFDLKGLTLIGCAIVYGD